MTDKQAWTPGPWRISRGGRKHRVAICGDGWLDFAKVVVRLESDLQDNETGLANARLIVAAPELLDVLQAFVQQEVDYMTRNNLGDPKKQYNVKWARAVIAKATGAAMTADNPVDVELMVPDVGEHTPSAIDLALPMLRKGEIESALQLLEAALKQSCRALGLRIVGDAA